MADEQTTPEFAQIITQKARGKRHYYTFCQATPYMTLAGKSTFILVYQGTCQRCGNPFEITTTPSYIPPYLNRRCKLCAKTRLARRATHAKNRRARRSRDDGDDAPVTRGRPRNDAERALLFQFLLDVLNEHGEPPPNDGTIPPDVTRVVPVELWRKAFYWRARPLEARDTKRKAFKRGAKDLQIRGCVRIEGGLVWACARPPHPPRS